MKTYLDGSELSFIPESDDDRAILKSFMESIEHNDNELADVSLDGVNLDELVVRPFCKGDASHCQLCGKPNAH